MKFKFDIEKIKSKFKEEKGNKMLILLLVGVLLLIIAWPAGTKEEQNPAVPKESAASAMTEEDILDAYIKKQEERLTGIIGSIQGAGNVSVMITAKASKALVVEKDKTTSNSQVDESDSSGGSRKTRDENYDEATIYTVDGSGSNVPYVVKELEPEIEGIVVVAEGGDNLNVVNEITTSISVLFDVPVHKIKVVKMNSN